MSLEPWGVTLVGVSWSTSTRLGGRASTRVGGTATGIGARVAARTARPCGRSDTGPVGQLLEQSGDASLGDGRSLPSEGRRDRT